MTEEEHDKLIALSTEQQDLCRKQIDTIEELKRCYSLAYLAGVHPSNLKGRVSSRIEYDGGNQLPLFRWRKAKLVIKVKPTTDPAANAAALRMGIKDTIEVPIQQVPHHLWDPEDLRAYLSTQASKEKKAKEKEHGNQ